MTTTNDRPLLDNLFAQWMQESERMLRSRNDPRISAFISVVKNGEKAPLKDLFTLANAVGLELKFNVTAKVDTEETT